MYIVTRGALYATKRGEKKVINLPQLGPLRTIIMTGLARHAHCYNSNMNIFVVSDHFLVIFKSYSTR